jgi:glycosyltransferase involved in cell wall biosynthesis
MKVSIAIPCYEMHGLGAQNLAYALNSIAIQTYKDIEVVISDHSNDRKIETLCQDYSDTLNVKYLRYEEKRGSSSANINNCIRHSTGGIVKILFQDDYLYDKYSLDNIVKEFENGASWLITSFYHTYDRRHLVRRFDPYLTRKLLISNSIGPPSGLSMINKDVIYFDEDLLWWMDTDYYKRLFDKFGLPRILTKPTFVTLVWEGQVSNTTAKSQVLREKEAAYLLQQKHVHTPMLLPNNSDIYEPSDLGYRVRKRLRAIYHRFIGHKYPFTKILLSLFGRSAQYAKVSDGK